MNAVFFSKKIRLVFILLLIFFVFKTLRSAEKSWMVDLLTNIYAADLLQNGKELYSKIPYNGGFTYLPIISALYLPLKKIKIDFSFSNVKLVWTTINILLVFFNLFIFYKMNFFRNKSTVSIFFFTAFFLFFHPMSDNIRYGNIKILALSLFSLYIYLDSINFLIPAGITIGFLIILSVQPVIFLIYLAFKKKYKTLFFAVLTVIFIISFSLVFIPIREYIFYFFTVIPNLQAEGASASPYIQSYDAMFKRLFINSNEYTIEWLHSESIAMIAPVLIKLSLFLTTVISLFKIRKINDENYFQFCLMIVCMILIHSINWEYHLTLVLIPAAILYNKFDYFDLKNIRKFSVYLIPLLLIGLYYPYDNKVFLSGPLLIVTNTKLLCLTFLFFIFFKLQKKNKL